MRNFIKIIEGINENADNDDMYGDQPSLLRTFANGGAQEFTDKGRADLPSKPNNPRFSDNSMTVDEDNEPIQRMGSDEDQSHLQQLHDMLTRTGLTDLEIRQGVGLDMDGKNKIAGQLGISVKEVDLLLNSLTQELRDNDAKSVDALLDDYYSDISEGTKENVEKQINTIYKHADNPKTPKERAAKSAKIAGGMMKNRDKKKVKEGFEPSKVYHIQHKGDERSYFIPQSEQKNGKHSGLQWDQGASGRSSKKPTKASYKHSAMWKETPHHEIPAHVKADVKETKHPFDQSVMERYSYERDSTGNVTVRDSETGKEKYLQGSAATNLLYQLDHGANEQATLAPLLLEKENLIDKHEDGSFEDEIASTAGTYNFPWNYHGEHGFGTAFYRTDSDRPDLKLQSIRDDDGNEVDVDDTMRHELLQQAQDFIGDE